MSNHEYRNTKWIHTDVQACIEPPSIPLIWEETEKVSECNIIKINIRQDHASATSKTYELKVPTLANRKPEQFLQMMNEFKTTTDGTGTTSGKIHFLRTVLHGKPLIELYVLAGQVGSMINGNLKLINEGLIGYFCPTNALNKQKRVMRRSMQKYRDLLFKIFSARLTELNNYLPLLPGSIASNKMDPE